MKRWAACCACVLVVMVTVSLAVLLVASLASLAADRSPQWSAVRNTYAAVHPTCEACGETPIQVHHVKPFRLWPELELELDAANLISLCPRCHIVFGHLGDTRANNPLVRQDASRHLARVKARPYTREAVARFEKQFSTSP